jgi:hypothetical protein
MTYFAIENSTLDNQLDYQFQKHYIEKTQEMG